LKRTIILCIALLALCTFAYCGQTSRIELTDGSIINGEIVSFANGIYVINTASFGEVQVESTNVYKIESADYPLAGDYPSADMPFAPTAQLGFPAVPTGQSGTPTQPRINSLTRELMSDPESAAIVTTLASDPRIQEMAKDPDVQNAAKSGDIQALMKNEKFMEIVNDPRIQEVSKELKHRINPR